MNKPRLPNYPMAAEDMEEITARFESVPAGESETGRDEVYVVFAGMRIAKKGNPGTPQAGTWISLEPGFQVAVNGAELIVIHDVKHASIH